ncbi:4-oxalomesaconate tautomerase [Actinoplanes octamycinicus]|uniref:4-oxalomesaconate tautomerase n=1 Tax=Actinoplanes octamycinicus TaxID=135948 RepID=A0A7W7MC93_9ACTN|nr:4-oxalomesaconate tautomerase [Actinoplanes octamycinicus]MBB4744902.1 4-oxalomesaconate tautomerase [Actinoplanes octamycinicus]GIE55488.1 FldA protein [Actinoplanes octamycinicus]
MSAPVPVLMMRGGTSKGAYFRAEDLPADPAERDRLLLAIMGSPDPRQIDGIGGGHPLTSKVAVISRSGHPAADVDYLFLQVQVDKPVVSAEQPCGNILAGVGPFAIERGLVGVQGRQTPVRVRMVNTGALAVVTVPTPDGRVEYAGDTALSGVPGTAARIEVEFRDTAGSVAPGLLPTGRVRDDLDGVPATLIDNGMPVVLLNADDLGVSGYETPAQLEAHAALCRRVEGLRLIAGKLMGLGDVSATTVPKMCLIAPAAHGGTLSTRMFIPHRVHASIGVLAAVSVGTAAAVPGSIAFLPERPETIRLEHPTGFSDVVVDVAAAGDEITVGRSAIVSTARLLLEGQVHPPRGKPWLNAPATSPTSPPSSSSPRCWTTPCGSSPTRWRWRRSTVAATASTCTPGTTTSGSRSR